jgi:hypothetical protein
MTAEEGTAAAAAAESQQKAATSNKKPQAKKFVSMNRRRNTKRVFQPKSWQKIPKAINLDTETPSNSTGLDSSVDD